MWRKTVLHLHTTPNESSTAEFNANDLVARAVAEGIDVLAITDHDRVDRCEAVSVAADGTKLVIVAGVEVDTDRGHLVVLAPGDGMQALSDFVARGGVQPGTKRAFEDIVDIVRAEAGPSGAYRDLLVLIGAHVDQEGSLLQSHQTHSLEKQVQQAMRLDGLEIVQETTRVQYISSGVKNTGKRKAIIRASDVHTADDEFRPTWIYLPEVSVQSIRHAFCVPEATIRFAEPTHEPLHVIESVAFDGGMHAGKSFLFDERTNALIGPPSTGKSLIIDAIRFVFGLTSPIEEIRLLSEKRLDRRLGEGTTVTVNGTSEGQPFLISRTWGGAQPVEPPFTPIVFSQTELVRRAMEEEPAMALLDVQCADSEPLKQTAKGIRNELAPAFIGALELAEQSRLVAERVDNSEDGLGATRAKLALLAGSEDLARRATQVGRLRAWRLGATEAIDEWLGRFEGDPMPDLPEMPVIDADVLDPAPFLPVDAILNEEQQSRDGARKTAVDTAECLRGLVMQNDTDLISLETSIRDELEGAGFSEGSELLAQLELLRSRLEGLENDAAQLTSLNSTIDERIDDLRKLVRQGEEAHLALRTARGKTCTAVNESMRTFFSKLEHDAHPEHVEGLLEQAKTGTYQRRSTLGAVRESLDRAQLLETAIRDTAGLAMPAAEEFAQQDEISRMARSRGDAATLSELAGSWPDDGLQITSKSSGDNYNQLTEGMRALAIKEISFADSVLPVVSDQPEDAVPPQNVFDDLVPTIRKQRVDRQFILASHDANIVVAGDVERVIVLTGTDTDESGTLHDPPIRNAAIELLEGGAAAFELRRERYGD